jgi:hypothetical protein
MESVDMWPDCDRSWLRRRYLWCQCWVELLGEQEGYRRDGVQLLETSTWFILYHRHYHIGRALQYIL